MGNGINSWGFLNMMETIIKLEQMFFHSIHEILMLEINFNVFADYIIKLIAKNIIYRQTDGKKWVYF